MCEICVDNLSKSYGDKQVLSQFSYCFKHGSITCITGSSGIGKTTLLRILMGLETAESGSVSTGIRYSAVFQENRLLEYLSVAENIAFVQTEKKQNDRIKQDITALLGKENIHKRVSELSGGMKRRVAIIRAMLADSDAVLLDEPFTGLDAATKQQVIEYILRERNNRTMIVVTHDRKDIEAFGAQECIMDMW